MEESITISFQVPKWAIDKHIYIFAGTELLAVKEVRISHKDGKHISKYLPLKMKPADGRCNPALCYPNSCCQISKIPFSERHFNNMKERLNSYNYGDKTCPFLGDHGCILGDGIPFKCLRSIATHFEGCTERLEAVE